MKSKNIFVLFGSTDKDSFCGSLADAYEAGARSTGHMVKRVNAGDISFDPILHKGYKVIQALEPDLVLIQTYMKWADHVVVFYPNWWGTMPAILKGIFDRMFLPGFAFRFQKEGLLRGIAWEKLLSGRSASVFITMNVHPFLAWILYGDNSNEIRRNILKFAGFSPVRLFKVGPIERMKQPALDALKRKATKLGARAW
ncbi:MAG: NAD(P)H-dependent oxidoreductase [Patescibacteria group bacterium]